MNEGEFFASVGGKVVAENNGPGYWNFGWIPIDARTPKQIKADFDACQSMPRFGIRGNWQLDDRRYPLWKAGIMVTGKHLRYNWQLTGSCVGAGGGNMAKTLMCVEIALGNEPEEYRELWWPYTYGLSRQLAGMRGRGEGSLGSTWAQAARELGIFDHDPEGYPDLPDFRDVDGWLQLTRDVELQWSAGESISEQWRGLGRKHLFRSVARIRSADEAVAALANGYPLTQASMFGFSPMIPSPRGNPSVRIASWNGRWAHQTWVDEYWDHPSEGELFRWGNNWGPRAHGSPTGDEPPGGVYITKRTMDEICRSGEVFAYSAFDGFPSRKLRWRF